MRKLNSIIFFYLLPIYILLVPHYAVHALELSENISLHGFLGQGLVTTTGNTFYGGKADHISAEFTEIGINTSWQKNDSLRFAGQVLFRNAGDLDAGNHFHFDYGLADITANTSENSNTGIRIGRYKNPLGFYNLTRDVPMTRPSIFLPQSIYFDRVRNAQLSTDGIMLYHNSFLSTGNLQIELGTGTSKFLLDESVEYAFLADNRAGDLEPDGLHSVGRILYEHDGGRMRFALSAFPGKLRYRTSNADPLQQGNIDLALYIASIEYNLPQWHFTSEYLTLSLDYNDFNPRFFSSNKSEGYGWYLQAIRDITSSVSLLVRYDTYQFDRPDKDGKQFSLQTGFPQHLRYSRDWTLGVNWEILPDFQVKVEYHNIEGTSWLSDIENPDQYHRDKFWDMIALSLFWQF